MKKIELLSPVGNLEMLNAAVNNGADAIYLAGKNYGARKYANNFTNDEIKEAIKYAHLYGVKVYVTINTVIYEGEIESFIEYVKFLYENHVDAVIMQDLGMIKLVLAKFPDLEVHASTQMHNHNEESIKYLKSIGVKRVVLARELSLDEVKNINVDIEKEIFVYGALCISYSGQCLMSSRVLNRSGNRGECAGMCRLPYELIEETTKIPTEGPYLLSPKELNTLANLREIIDSQVDSLKIEGRMKSPEYVGYVTKIFRRLIDCYYNNEVMNVYDEEIVNLKKLYNREFTLGHLFGSRNTKLMNIKSPNHIGTPLGKAYIEKNKIKIVLSDNIRQGDGIRFVPAKGMIVNYLYDSNLLLINSAKKGDTVYVDNKIGLENDADVLKTLDVDLMEKINDIPKRKVPINVMVEAKIGKPLIATITDNVNNITQSLGMVEKSKKCPVRIEEIVDRFSKVNDTIFRIVDINVNADKDIFIPVKVMNDLRRDVLLKLEKKILDRPSDLRYGNYTLDVNKMSLTNSINFYVNTEEQLKYLLNKKINIYTDNLFFYKKYKSENVYFATDRVMYKLPNMSNDNILASNLSSLVKYASCNNVITSLYLNVTNSYMIDEFIKLGSNKITLSIENTYDDVKAMIYSFKSRNNFIPNLEIFVYGRVELMVMKHCFLNMFINKDKECSICKNNKQYYLKDRNAKLFPIITKNCNNYILDCNNINLLDKVKDYNKIGVTNYSVKLFNESIEEIDKILSVFNI